MNMEHGFRATMTAQLGKGDALVELLLSAANGAGPASSEHCGVFVVSRSATNSDIVYVTEGWTSKEAHDEVIAGAEAQALLGKVGALLAGEVRYADELPIGGKATIN